MKVEYPHDLFVSKRLDMHWPHWNHHYWTAYLEYVSVQMDNKHTYFQLLAAAMLQFLHKFETHMQIVYQKSTPANTTVTHQGLMAIDIERGHVILSPEKAAAGLCACLSGSPSTGATNLHMYE